MGFEVLDAGGSAPPRGHGAAPQPATGEVVELDDLAAPAACPGSSPTERRPRRRRGSLPTVAVVAVVAALSGIALGRHGAVLDDLERERSALAVAAQAVGETPFTLPIGLGAELRVLVTNLGPRTVRIGPLPRLSAGITTGTVSVPGDGQVAPGATVTVVMRTSVDCRVGRVLTPRLGVLTADGVQHTAAVTMPDGGRPSDAVCPRRSTSSALSAALAGTVLRPAVQLTNLSPDPMRVTLPDQTLYPYRDGDHLQIATWPVLPTTIRPHDRLTVRLRLVPHGCVAELQDLQRLDLATLTIAATALRDSGLQPAGSVDVDLTGLVSAAMVRSCG